jgi:Molybdopterin-binding domain of aldehyde dehydrogenase
MQGFGYAPMEELRTEEGQMSTLSLGEYKVPTIKDILELVTVLLDPSLGPAPYEVKTSAKAATPRWPRPLPTPCSTRWACVLWTYRSRRKRCLPLCQRSVESRHVTHNRTMMTMSMQRCSRCRSIHLLTCRRP